MISKFGLFTILLFATSLSHSASYSHSEPVFVKTESKIENPWTGELKFGGVFNTGNSDNKNFHGQLGLAYKTHQWNSVFSLQGQLNRAKNKTSAANIRANLDAHYALREYDYLFFKSNATFDQFGSFDQVFKEAVGYGYYIVKNDSTQLTIEAGPGGSHKRISGKGQQVNQFVLNIGSELKHKFNEYTQIKTKIDVDAADRFTHIRSESAVKSKISETLSLEVSLTITHDTTIPPSSKNTEKTDTVTKISIVYAF